MVKGKAMAKKKVAKKAAKKTAKKTSVKKVSKKKESAGVTKTGVLKVGDYAPDFCLQDQNGNQVSLTDFKGKNVVVYFYPRAMTPGCTTQACGLRDTAVELKAANIVVLGISADSVLKLKQFEQKQHLNFHLLSDESKEVIRAYGSWGPKKFMGREFDGILRQSFLIDEEGKVAHIMHKVNTGTHHDDVLNFFKNRG